MKSMKSSMKDLKAVMVKREEERKKGFADRDERINLLKEELSSLKSQQEGI